MIVNLAAIDFYIWINIDWPMGLTDLSNMCAGFSWCILCKKSVIDSLKVLLVKNRKLPFELYNSLWLLTGTTKISESSFGLADKAINNWFHTQTHTHRSNGVNVLSEIKSYFWFDLRIISIIIIIGNNHNIFFFVEAHILCSAKQKEGL